MIPLLFYRKNRKSNKPLTKVKAQVQYPVYGQQLPNVCLFGYAVLLGQTVTSTMSLLQVKVFSNTNSFVDVLSSHDDDSFVGFPLGSLLDAVSPSTGGEEVQGRYLFAVIDQGRPT